MSNELFEIRATLVRALGQVDAMLAGHVRSTDDNPARWRARPGGALNEAGAAEMERRFDAGESDSQIGIAMAVSLDGVSRRRALWRRKRAS